MRRIDVLRTLALSSALILALGGVGCAGEENSGETGAPPSVGASPPAEALVDAADETISSAEKPDTEASEEEEE